MAVMAPLYIPEHSWSSFRDDLKKLKAKGFNTLSVDIWWGMVQEQGPQSFDWSYYDRLYAVLVAEDMSWIPLLSTHACGANVGDNHDIPMPKWVWNVEGVEKFKSEIGNESLEAISYFSDPKVFDLYKIFWQGFLDRYLTTDEDKNRVKEIGLSLGPSGELHYPAYHSHDAKNALARYPQRGLFQGLGERAIKSFENFVETKNDDSKAFSLESLPKMLSDGLLLQKHLADDALKTVFVWYHESLLLHLENILNLAFDVFLSEHVLTIKIPGIHWHQERHAELMNGLISPLDAPLSWNSEELGLGYSPIFCLIRDVLDQNPGFQLKLYLTAAATADSLEPFSRAESLVRAFAHLSQQTGIPLALENALAGDLYCSKSLSILSGHLSSKRASDYTLLRMEDVLRSEVLSQDALLS